MDRENPQMNITIPDYHVAKGDDYLMIRIYDITFDITDIEFNVPDDNNEIDAAMLVYKYTILDGELSEDIPEDLVKEWLNHIVTDEIDTMMNGR